MKKILLLSTIGIISMTLLSCGGGPKIVYASGARMASSGSITTIPVYWKDGVINDLTASGNAMANAIFVKGSDVYTAGMSQEGSDSVACYWKNNEQTLLTSSGVQDSVGSGIFVDGQGNIYVSGSCDKGAQDIACYWKNGSLVELTDGTSDSGATSIFVADDGNVYIAGNKDGAGGYWINDAAHFTTLVADGMIYSVKVKNGSVYAAGTDDTGSHGKAVYWIGDTKTELTSGIASDAVAPDIELSETSVYVNGLDDDYSEPVYWKNTEDSRTALDLGTYFMAIVPFFPMALDEENVYIATNVVTTDGGSDYTPVYWKNGVMQLLTKGTSSKAVVSDIFVE